MSKKETTKFLVQIISPTRHRRPLRLIPGTAKTAIISLASATTT